MVIRYRQDQDMCNERPDQKVKSPASLEAIDYWRQHDHLKQDDYEIPYPRSSLQNTSRSRVVGENRFIRLFRKRNHKWDRGPEQVRRQESEEPGPDEVARRAQRHHPLAKYPAPARNIGTAKSISCRSAMPNWHGVQDVDEERPPEPEDAWIATTAMIATPFT